MAKTHFWICSRDGFVNTPHALRRESANDKCEQCGFAREAKDELGAELNADIAPADAVIAKRA
jgi:hypothetical protein